MILIYVKSEKAVQFLIKLLKYSFYDLKSRIARVLGKIGSPAKDALLELHNSYRNQKNIIVKFSFLQAMLRIEPSNRQYLKIMIEDLLPHPFVGKKLDQVVFISRFFHYKKPIKAYILRTIGEIAGKEAAGEYLDFNGNMWTMLEWWGER
jgi:hypothetical protein